MNVDQLVREREDPSLPSEKMVEKFGSWDRTYSVDSLEEMSPSGLEATRLEFENDVSQFLTVHRPGKRIEQKQALAHLTGENPYTADEWRSARKRIREEAKEIRLRFRKAEGTVEAERREENREFAFRLIDAVTPDRFDFTLFRR